MNNNARADNSFRKVLVFMLSLTLFGLNNKHYAIGLNRFFIRVICCNLGMYLI